LGRRAWAEAAGIGSADQPEPDLGLRVAGEQPMRGGNLVCIGLEGAYIDVDGDKLAGILCAEIRLLRSGERQAEEIRKSASPQ
jgi:hypothetical protein